MQQINLFNPALIAKKEWLNTRFLAIVFGFLIAVMIVSYVSSHNTLRPLQAEADASTAELDTLQAELDALTLQEDLQSTDNSLQNELFLVRSKLKQTENLLTLTGLNMDAADSSHLAILQGFARQHTLGIWLTGLERTEGSQLRIHGRALSPDLVPTYIAKLGSDRAFAGKTFSTLNISQGKVEAEINPAETEPASVKNPFFEFTLQSAQPELATSGATE